MASPTTATQLKAAEADLAEAQAVLDAPKRHAEATSRVLGLKRRQVREQRLAHAIDIDPDFPGKLAYAEEALAKAAMNLERERARCFGGPVRPALVQGDADSIDFTPTEHEPIVLRMRTADLEYQYAEQAWRLANARARTLRSFPDRLHAGELAQANAERWREHDQGKKERQRRRSGVIETIRVRVGAGMGVGGVRI